MPVFEERCAACERTTEVYLARWDDQDPACERWGGQQERLASNFAVTFTGPITARYNDKKREGAHADGFWAYRKRSSISGQPEPVFIDNWQQLKEFNKSEGLAAPGEAPTNATISKDGKSISGDGFAGQWRGALPGVPSAFFRMNRSLTALGGKSPEPPPSAPPYPV